VKIKKKKKIKIHQQARKAPEKNNNEFPISLCALRIAIERIIEQWKENAFDFK
jgi:hypothetical protein